MKFPLLCGVNTSFALSLLAWSSDASISSNSSMSATIMSPFQIPPRVQYIAEEYSWQDVCSKLMQSRYVFRRNRVKRAFRTAFHKVSSHQTRDLERFADRYSIPWKLPTIFHPDLTATVPQMSRLSLYALLFQQSHVFLICVALTYNDSRKDLHRLCQIARNYQCKWLLVSLSALRTFVRSSLFPKKFFCTTTAYRWLFRDSISSLRILWFAVIKSPKFSARGTTVPVRLLQEALVNSAFKQISQFGAFGKWVSEFSLRIRYHFCSRL